MLGLIKRSFFTGLVFLLTLTSINLLSCISMNNQECRIRPHIVESNSEESIFFPFSIKTSKCNGSCNNINNPYAKLCVPDVVKKLNDRVLNTLTFNFLATLCNVNNYWKKAQNGMKRVNVNVN